MMAVDCFYAADLCARARRPGSRSVSRCSDAGMRRAGSAGALFGYVLTALAIWAPIRLGVPSAPDFPRRVGGCRGAGVVPRAPLVGSARRAAAVDTAGHARARRVWLLTLVIAVPPFARVGVDRRVGQPAIPRLLHRRFRVAHGADRGGREVRVAAAQPLSRPPSDSLLLDLLPPAGRRGGDGAVRAGRRGNVSEGERDRDGPAVRVGDLHLRVDRASARLAGGRRGRAGDRRVERRRGLRALAVLAGRRTARRGAQSQHRRAGQLVAAARPAHRRPAALFLVGAAALDGLCARAGRAGGRQRRGERGAPLARSRWPAWPWPGRR